MPYTIYALTEPGRPDAIRYVGLTEKRIKVRLAKHLQEAKSRKNTHKLNWIRSLVAAGQSPDVHALERGDGGMVEANQAEMFWIRELKERGYRLTNTTEGGDGVRPTAETREKIGAASKRNGAAAGQRIAAIWRERREQQCKAIRASMTPERISEARAATVASWRDNHEKRTEAIRRANLGRKDSDDARKRKSEGAKRRAAEIAANNKRSWETNREARMEAIWRGAAKRRITMAARKAAAA